MTDRIPPEWIEAAAKAAEACDKSWAQDAEAALVAVNPLIRASIEAENVRLRAALEEAYQEMKLWAKNESGSTFSSPRIEAILKTTGEK
jgi:hypothetical protein